MERRTHWRKAATDAALAFAGHPVGNESIREKKVRDLSYCMTKIERWFGHRHRRVALAIQRIALNQNKGQAA